MLTILLTALTIIGWILLGLLCIFLLIILLVLCWPLGYRLQGSVNGTTVRLNIKVHWLANIFRFYFTYPEPGRLIGKFLFFTFFDSGVQKEEKQKKTKAKKKKTGKTIETQQADKKAEDKKAEDTKAEDTKSEDTKSEDTKAEDTKSEDTDSIICDDNNKLSENNNMQCENDNKEEASDRDSFWKRIYNYILEKFSKIKYTIHKIYDRIKKILDNYQYYHDLLTDSETKLLYQHTITRALKVFKNIRPRRIAADLEFGTGSPDTTGYAYGIYGMISSLLGKNVIVTANFEEAVLAGTFNITGHITGFVLLVNGLSLFFDRRLRLLIKKLVREEA